ncbi:MAG: class I SAM-dependent methyltransferase [Dehalococcoidia bacterium]|nr:MAG: class I SAM-dependent methyltransferase [Dehalococcoidia bacterium]
MALDVMPRIAYLAHRYGGYVPLSRLNTVSRYIDKKARTILDIGCNDGITMLFLNRRKRYRATGVDISAEAVRVASARKTHDAYITGNVLDLPFNEHSYDLVLSMQMLEHLDKEDGYALIDKMEKTARRQVIITTPVGFHELLDHPGTGGADHKSGWSVDEFHKRGYTVKGNKLRIERYAGNIIYKHTPWLAPVHSAFWLTLGVILAPLPYYFPGIFAFDMVCVKDLDAGGQPG